MKDLCDQNYRILQMKISNFDSWNKVLKLIFDVFCDRL